MVGKINLNDHRYFYGNKGFTSILNEVIGLARIHYTNYNNYDVIVDDTQVLNIFNNNYNLKNGDKCYNVSDVFFKDFMKGVYDNRFNAHTPFNVEDLNSRKINSFLTLKKEISDRMSSLKIELLGEDNYIGIHIRGTDKIIESPEIKIDDVYRYIDIALNERKDIKKIFLATDDIFYLEKLLKRYGEDLIVYNKNNIISENKEPIHKRYEREKINLEVMSDVYILSKCHYFMYCFSNVSFLVLTMMDDYNKKIININN